MTSSSVLLLALSASMVVLQGCGNTAKRSDVDSQPPVQAESITPTAVQAPPAAAPRASITEPVATTVPVAAESPAPAVALPHSAPQQPDDKTVPSPVLVNRYTVVPGDTLATIAARKEVYGDARLWPLLHRVNARQIGPDALIFPKQVLIVDRNYTQDDVRALIYFPKAASSPTPAPSAPMLATPASPSTSIPGTVAVAPASPASAEVINQPEPLPLPRSALAATTEGTRPARTSDFLQSARQAFSAGNFYLAKNYYMAYLKDKNNDATAWGELGNIHYVEGNYTEAARAYYNTANLLIDHGQTARALDLMPAIQLGEPGLSDALYQRLTTIKR